MSGEFDPRKDSHSTKIEQRAQIFVKLKFTESYHSKISGSYNGVFSTLPFLNCSQLLKLYFL